MFFFSFLAFCFDFTTQQATQRTELRTSWGQEMFGRSGRAVKKIVDIY
jgi:hypothetical protein